MQFNNFNLVFNQCNTVKRVEIRYIIFLLFCPMTDKYLWSFSFDVPALPHFYEKTTLKLSQCAELLMSL